MSHHPEQIKNHQLEELICQNRLIIRLLSIIAAEDAPSILTSIKSCSRKEHTCPHQVQ